MKNQTKDSRSIVIALSQSEMNKLVEKAQGVHLKPELLAKAWVEEKLNIIQTVDKSGTISAAQVSSEALGKSKTGRKTSASESLEHFVKRFSKDVVCYNKNLGDRYNLKKYESNVRRHMGVFGWVNENKTKGMFVVSTYKYLADKQGIADADKEKPNLFFAGKNETDPNMLKRSVGLIFFVKRNSNGKDYQKAVRALRVVCKKKR